MLFFNFPDGEASWTHIYSDVWCQVRVLSNITQLSCITSKATKHCSQGLPQDKREYQRYQTREMHLECLFDWGLKANPCSKISLVLCLIFFSSWLNLKSILTQFHCYHLSLQLDSESHLQDMPPFPFSVSGCYIWNNWMLRAVT